MGKRQIVDGQGISKETPRIPSNGGRSKPKRVFTASVRRDLSAPILPPDGQPVFLPNWLNQLSDVRKSLIPGGNGRNRADYIKSGLIH